jgi:hypothetical protein
MSGESPNGTAFAESTPPVYEKKFKLQQGDTPKRIQHTSFYGIFERSAFFVRKASYSCSSYISTGISHSIIAHKKSLIEFPKSFIARKIQRQRAAFHLSKAIIHHSSFKSIFIMSTTSDWLPGNHTLLYHQSGTTVTYLTPENLLRFGIMGNSLSWNQTEFLPRHGTFVAAVDDWMNPAERTPTKTAALTTAEKAFVTVVKYLSR